MIRKLIPGANAALTAENPGLTSVLVGFGWSMVSSRGPQSELVPMAIMCDSAGRAVSDEHLVFFNQIMTPEGGMEFVGTEDIEQIDVHLSLIPDNVAKIAFVVYVDPEVRGTGTFSAVRNPYVRVADPRNRELVRFEIPAENRDSIKAMIFGEIYRHAGGWKFRALGQGYVNGLSGIASDFRVGM